MIRPRYKWPYVVSFVRPETGQTIWWMVSRLDAEAFHALLVAFAEELGLGPNRRVLLVLDGAGWHTGADAGPAAGVELLVLPAYGPELQPAEHLWTLCDAVLVDRDFNVLAELQAVLVPHLVSLTERLLRIRSLTLFRWWPTTGPPPV